jgi:hypothetical protein
VSEREAGRRCDVRPRAARTRNPDGDAITNPRCRTRRPYRAALDSRRALGSTLRATELAHEAYLRLERQRAVDWQNRDHFYAIAATVVRRVRVDFLRERGAEKCGGGLLQMPYDEFELQRDEAAASNFTRGKLMKSKKLLYTRVALAPLAALAAFGISAGPQNNPDPPPICDDYQCSKEGECPYECPPGGGGGGPNPPPGGGGGQPPTHGN